MRKIILVFMLAAVLVFGLIASAEEKTTCKNSVRFIRGEQFTLKVKGCANTQLKIKGEKELPKLRRVVVKDGEEKLVMPAEKYKQENAWILDLDQGEYEFVFLKPHPKGLSVVLSTQ